MNFRHAVLSVVAVTLLAACESAAPALNTHQVPRVAPDFSHRTPPVQASATDQTATRYPVSSRPSPLFHFYAGDRHVVGDGFTKKFREPCSNMPFPGQIIIAYAMHECWLGYWGHPMDAGIMYMLGYEPGTHHRTQAMLVGPGNAPLREVALQNGRGVAAVRAWGRTCAVIGYGKSGVRSYYEPFGNRFVGFCRWRR